MRKITVILLPLVFLSCVKDASRTSVGDPDSDSADPEVTYNLEHSEGISDLNKAFKFIINVGGDKSVDTEVKKARVTGYCEGQNAGQLYLENVVDHTSNGTPVGSVFTASYLMNMFKINETYNCNLTLSPFDEGENPLEGRVEGKVSFEVHRDNFFGINLEDHGEINSYTTTQIHSSIIEINEPQNFETESSKTGQMMLKIICDNGREDLIEREGLFDLNSERNRPTVTDIFSDSEFDPFKPLKTMNEFKWWFLGLDGTCMIVNDREGSAYFLWSHLFTFVNF